MGQGIRRRGRHLNMTEAATAYGWPRLMRLPIAAAYLDMTPSTFLGEVARDRLPPPVMFGGRDRWDRHAIDKALDEDTADLNWRSQQPGLNPSALSGGVDPATGSVHTVAGIAERWGCSTELVYNSIRAGKLESFKLGPRLHRVRHDRLLAYEAEYGRPS